MNGQGSNPADISPRGTWPPDDPGARAVDAGSTQGRAAPSTFGRSGELGSFSSATTSFCGTTVLPAPHRFHDSPAAVVGGPNPSVVAMHEPGGGGEGPRPALPGGDHAEPWRPLAPAATALPRLATLQGGHPGLDDAAAFASTSAALDAASRPHLHQAVRRPVASCWGPASAHGGALLPIFAGPGVLRGTPLAVAHTAAHPQEQEATLSTGCLGTRVGGDADRSRDDEAARRFPLKLPLKAEAPSAGPTRASCPGSWKSPPVTQGVCGVPGVGPCRGLAESPFVEWQRPATGAVIDGGTLVGGGVPGDESRSSAVGEIVPSFSRERSPAVIVVEHGRSNVDRTAGDAVVRDGTSGTLVSDFSSLEPPFKPTRAATSSFHADEAATGAQPPPPSECAWRAASEPALSVHVSAHPRRVARGARLAGAAGIAVAYGSAPLHGELSLADFETFASGLASSCAALEFDQRANELSSLEPAARPLPPGHLGAPASTELHSVRASSFEGALSSAHLPLSSSGAAPLVPAASPGLHSSLASTSSPGLRPRLPPTPSPGLHVSSVSASFSHPPSSLVPAAPGPSSASDLPPVANRRVRSSSPLVAGGGEEERRRAKAREYNRLAQARYRANRRERKRRADEERAASRAALQAARVEHAALLHRQEILERLVAHRDECVMVLESARSVLCRPSRGIRSAASLLTSPGAHADPMHALFTVARAMDLPRIPGLTNGELGRIDAFNLMVREGDVAEVVQVDDELAAAENNLLANHYRYLGMLFTANLAIKVKVRACRIELVEEGREDPGEDTDQPIDIGEIFRTLDSHAEETAYGVDREEHRDFAAGAPGATRSATADGPTLKGAERSAGGLASRAAVPGTVGVPAPGKASPADFGSARVDGVVPDRGGPRASTTGTYASSVGTSMPTRALNADAEMGKLASAAFPLGRPSASLAPADDGTMAAERPASPRPPIPADHVARHASSGTFCSRPELVSSCASSTRGHGSETVEPSGCRGAGNEASVTLHSKATNRVADDGAAASAVPIPARAADVQTHASTRSVETSENEPPMPPLPPGTFRLAPAASYPGDSSQAGSAESDFEGGFGAKLPPMSDFSMCSGASAALMLMAGQSRPTMLEAIRIWHTARAHLFKSTRAGHTAYINMQILLRTVLERRPKDIAQVFQGETYEVRDVVNDPRHWRRVARGLALRADQLVIVRETAELVRKTLREIVARRRSALAQLIEALKDTWGIDRFLQEAREAMRRGETASGNAGAGGDPGHPPGRADPSKRDTAAPENPRGASVVRGDPQDSRRECETATPAPASYSLRGQAASTVHAVAQLQALQDTLSDERAVWMHVYAKLHSTFDQRQVVGMHLLSWPCHVDLAKVLDAILLEEARKERQSATGASTAPRRSDRRFAGLRALLSKEAKDDPFRYNEEEDGLEYIESVERLARGEGGEGFFLFGEYGPNQHDDGLQGSWVPHHFRDVAI